MEWIDIKQKWPDYDPNYTPAFSLLIAASNNRYYTGYAVIEYGKIKFHQHNGRQIMNVTHWMPLPKIK